MEVEKSAWIERQACRFLEARLLSAEQNVVSATYAICDAEALWDALEAKGYIKALGPVKRGDGQVGPEG